MQNFRGLGLCVCVCARERERAHSSRTALLNTVRRDVSLTDFFSLGCQLACGALCPWDRRGRQVFLIGFGFQPEHFGGWAWGRDELLITAETEEELRTFSPGPRDAAGTASSLPSPGSPLPALDCQDRGCTMGVPCRGDCLAGLTQTQVAVAAACPRVS